MAAREAKLEHVVEMSQWTSHRAHIANMTRQTWLVDQLLSMIPGGAHTLLNPGMFADPARRPPGVVLMIAPVIAGIAVGLGRSQAGRQLAISLHLGLIFVLQSFRMGVELTLSSLQDAGFVPRLLTLTGGNVEMVVALTAPLAALIAMRGASGRRIAFVWNVVGLLSLLNVAARAMLTTPGPLNLIHAELPNVAMGMFPFTFIPGFLAPLALALHVLAFRALRAASSAHRAAGEQADFAI